jgi:DNA topoisomerase-1
MPKRLLIVESPTKAKTITKFLGKDYEVLSSFGHVRDLPTKKTGVDVAHDFKPTYEVPERSKKAVSDLAKAARGVDEVYLATDEDREGEAIAWHVAELLGLDPKEANRVTFHEITKGAIDQAVEHPRKLDMNLVHAQQARRILDRLVGYELSPFLWKTVQRGLSAGRVQSVAVRLIVERERERLAFKQDEFWTIDAVFAKDGADFEAKLWSVDGKKLDKLAIKGEAEAKKLVETLAGAAFTIGTIERKQITKAPPAPFTTSTLQMEANSRLGMSAKQTMTLAQKLYETGRITYMRTDSQNLAEKFLGEAQAYVKEQFGAEYATGAKTYRTKSKGAQEAHEAIRPTEVTMRAEDLPASADAGMKKLYDLIWRRAVASQLPSAKLDRTAVDVIAKGHAFRATGNTIAFDGYMKVYHGAQEKILPELSEGDAVETREIKPEQHFTEPPPRYSDATLVKAMEEFGIGRPSTYAPTISTVIDRGYVERDDNKKLYPTEIALIVTDVLKEHFPQIVDYKFTANMEESLDDVAEGKKEWVPALKEFYGPFHETLESKSKSLKREDVMKERVVGTDPKSGLSVIAKSGRFGPFVQLGEWSEEDRKAKVNKPRSASLMKGDSIDALTLEAALKLLELPRVVGKNAQGEDIVANTGRFGPYLKAGKTTVSLPPEYDPRAIDEAKAIELLANAAELKKKMLEPIAQLGKDPATGNEMLVKNGRFGPYLTDGVTNVSVPKKIDPKALTAEEAIELLAKKRVAPKRAWGPRKAKKSDE